MTEEMNSGEEKGQQDELKKLLDSTEPLLLKFRDLCPGTYKHSQSLVAMIENVATALDLDVVKMKIAAQYHDIGKMLNPKYFAENQLEEEDPHEKLSPLVSYQIITRHVSDSAMILANDNRFPREIIQIISQHHGQSVLKYFFSKAETDVDDAFRYRTPKPKCAESAILMICDCVEATSRSLVQGGKLNVNEVIEKTMTSLQDDGQLDDVVMRLGDLRTVKETLIKELEGTYQKRPDYDEAAKKDTVED